MNYYRSCVGYRQAIYTNRHHYHARFADMIDELPLRPGVSGALQRAIHPIVAIAATTLRRCETRTGNQRRVRKKV
eukprot:COSAG01_NODE_7221_length_3299_cov_5.049375_4_plen_75_part_00